MVLPVILILLFNFIFAHEDQRDIIIVVLLISQNCTDSQKRFVVVCVAAWSFLLENNN